MAAVVLVVLRLEPKPKVGPYAAVATTVGVMALFIAPTVWASYTVFQGPKGFMPLAGPPSSQNNQGGLGESNAPGSGQGPFGVGNPSGALPGGSLSDSASGNVADPALIDYLLANQGDAKYLAATTSAKSTAPIILSTDKPVISLGRYSGIDPVFATKQLADLLYEGAVRFLLIPYRVPRGGPGGLHSQPQNESARWVQHECEQVPRKLWQSPSLGEAGVPSIKNHQTLYDCGAGGR